MGLLDREREGERERERERERENLEGSVLAVGSDGYLSVCSRLQHV